ncbi:non-hydrolyzing UDP-N-acetylglucosamine 2-epimerase [Pikeienuella sp. HZG-20]|uniref:non-hydrolyzing UDP-N-acetylglucosamine 2-epimerase n=1 Tax=Paludibacillus litoralis TaxID=3133267 RepID=UPI0030EE33C7
MSKEICVIVGTRPGIIMMAPIIHALQAADHPHYVIHTGQHYSPEMDVELFEDLGLTAPAYHLKGAAEAQTHATKTARMMEGCEAAFLERRPGVVLVNGDANSNVAAALAGRKLGVPLAHSEAGERSYDWRMPEEHNRRIMDHISELLFATNDKARDILLGEKVPGAVHVTGNTIVDASLNHAVVAQERSNALSERGLTAQDYLLLTAHREENVDQPDRLEAIVRGAQAAGEAAGCDVVFPAHPRTAKNLEAFGLMDLARKSSRIRMTPALRYLDFMQLLINARAVVTDSGGVQQEAFIHRRPCVTIRDNTEWTETVARRGNRIAGASDPERICGAVVAALAETDADWTPVFGDGRAAERIVAHCARLLEDGAPS